MQKQDAQLNLTPDETNLTEVVSRGICVLLKQNANNFIVKNCFKP